MPHRLYYITQAKREKNEDKKWLAPRLALVLMVLVTLAGGASSQATPSTSPENSAPAATEVNTSTPSPESVTDLSTARISLDELPEGFEEIARDEILAEQKASGNDEFLPEALFAFVNAENFHLILGMDFLLVEATDNLGFNAALEDAKDTLKDFAGAMGAKNIREQEVLEGMETLGEKQVAMTMLADVKDVPMRVNAVMFRRDLVGGMLLSMTIEGQPESVSLRELGKLLDKPFQENLKTVG
jgi:hypothetical protein